MKTLTSPIRSQAIDLCRDDGSPPFPGECKTTFQQIARSCVHLIQANSKSAIAADSDAVHRMRIELTRLRAAALFFSPMIADDAWPAISKELKWLNSALGKARDRDVTVSYTCRKRYRRWANRSRRALVRAQDKSHRKLTAKLLSDRHDRLIATVSGWAEHGPWALSGQSGLSEPTGIFSESRLCSWRMQISREGRHLRLLHRKQLHRLRIRCKRYRYVVTALQSLEVPLARQDLRFCETAKCVHAALGDLRDLKRLRRAVCSRPPGYGKTKRTLLQRAEKPFRHHGP
jgi:CHAD domain-containing protein